MYVKSVIMKLINIEMYYFDKEFLFFLNGLSMRMLNGAILNESKKTIENNTKFTIIVMI